MKILSYVLVIIGTLIGGYELLNTLAFAESAPQQAAGAALALAWAVLPYCFARAVEKLGEETFFQALEKHEAQKETARAVSKVMQPSQPVGRGFVEVKPKF